MTHTYTIIDLGERLEVATFQDESIAQSYTDEMSYTMGRPDFKVQKNNIYDSIEEYEKVLRLHKTHGPKYSY